MFINICHSCHKSFIPDQQIEMYNEITQAPKPNWCYKCLINQFSLEELKEYRRLREEYLKNKRR